MISSNNSRGIKCVIHKSPMVCGDCFCKNKGEEAPRHEEVGLSHLNAGPLDALCGSSLMFFTPQFIWEREKLKGNNQRAKTHFQSSSDMFRDFVSASPPALTGLVGQRGHK